MKIFKNALFMGFFFLTSLTVFSQGNTNSSINGQVIDNKSSGIPMSNIVAVHIPSGTKYVASTDIDGFFRISNMRVGGPYTVTFSYVGFKTQDVKNIILQLGDSQSLKILLEQEANQLNDVVVIAQKNNIFNSKKTGAQTIIDSKKISIIWINTKLCYFRTYNNFFINHLDINQINYGKMYSLRLPLFIKRRLYKLWF